MTELSKTYDPKIIESHWYSTWDAAGHFVPQGSGRSFCLMLPPPNVTGNLHMGHAMESALMDCLIRYHRMLGDNTHWQVGTDHAGIATQMVVERQLEAKGTTRAALGREKFTKQVWEWKAESGGNIVSQFKRMGVSADWSRERFTMDEGLSAAVQTVFVQLYEQGLIYRGQRLVNWDTRLKTAVSDLEVDMQDADTSLWHLRYPVEGLENTFIIVATTRPETMLGDMAVAVNPQDERYQHLIGKYALLPLTDRRIPIIADDYVDAEFGTGCVKITPAHDFNDYEMGQRHGLPMISVLDLDGKINGNGPKVYQGLDRFEARKRIVKDLQALDLMEKIEPYTTKRPVGDRSGTVLEPMLTDQWYVKVEPLAKVAIEAVEKGEIEFVPSSWNNTYFSWMRDIKDWCISRQLWWGHRIPAWYDDKGQVYVGESEEDVRQKHQIPASVNLRQDEDVLDTWFSSALWPFSTLGWPENTEEFKTFYPTSVLICGFDIIFFWVARMIMMGYKFTDNPPFRKVYIHGLLCDSEGKKMSKSKGNVLDPIDLIDGIDLESLVKKRVSGLMQPQMAKSIEESTRRDFPEGIQAFGTDATRLTFCSLPATQRHITFDMKRVSGYRNFCNKLWNASRYVFMVMEGHTLPDMKDCDLSLPDRYILSKLQTCIVSTHAALADFRFDLATQALYDFVWYELCDWYLELSKPLLQDENPRVQAGARWTLVTVLDATLRLLHPFIPFITEEIWQRVAVFTKPALNSLMLMDYPVLNAELQDPQAELDMVWIQNLILAVRNIRGEMNIAPKVEFNILVKQGTNDDSERYEAQRALIKKLANVTDALFVDANHDVPMSATAVVGHLEIFVPLAGLIDKEAEITRLNKQITKLADEHGKLFGKLSNESYVARAPADVVARDKARVTELTDTIDKLKTQIERIAGA